MADTPEAMEPLEKLETSGTPQNQEASKAQEMPEALQGREASEVAEAAAAPVVLEGTTASVTQEAAAPVAQEAAESAASEVQVAPEVPAAPEEPAATGGPAVSEAPTKIADFTDEEIAGEEEFLRGLPRLNLGAFFMPGIWGPAHGFWVCILFYPLYIFADYMFYGAYAMTEVWTVALAIITGVLLLALHIGFALVSQPLAAHRAESQGISREEYLRRERIWAVVCILIAIIGLAWATYYNLDVRTVLK